MTSHSRNTPGFASPYLVMEYVEGEPLNDRLRRQGHMQPREAARIVREIALALADAHAKGLVHRDVKPSNILLEAGSGRSKLTDFGLARVLDSAAAMASQPGQIVGTPAYMSPEQIATPERIDGRSDVYSLGVVLYELLTGERPFRGVGHMLLDQVVHDEPRPPRKLHDAIPRDLETITLKCLAKDPGHRYSTARELADELQRWLDGMSIQARPVGVAGKTVRWCRRRPSQAAAAGLAAVVLMAVTALAISVGFIVQLREEQLKTQAARREVVLKGGLTECQRGRVAQGMLMWANYLATVPESEELQRPIRANLAAWYHQLWPLKAIIPDKDIDYATLSPDGKIVLTVKRATDDKHGEVRIWDAATAKPVGKPIPHDHHDEVPPVFSSDGRTILTRIENLVYRWDATTGKQLGGPYRVPGEIKALAFGPDGTTIRTASAANEAALPLFTASTVGFLGSALGQGPILAASAHISGQMCVVEIRTWSVATGDYHSLFLPTYQYPVYVYFSPDSKRVLTRSLGISRLWDTTAGKELHRFEGHKGITTSLAFGLDEKLLLVGSEDFTARLLDTATGKEKPAYKGNQRNIEVVAFSRDGRTIGTGSADGTVRLWDTATGEQLGAPMAHGGKITAVSMSSDRSTILTLSSDKLTRLWSGPPAGTRVPVLPHSSPVRFVAFSHDGRHALTCTWPSAEQTEQRFDHQQGEALVWDLTTRSPLAPPVRHDGRITAMTFSPDNKMVLTGSMDKKARLWDINNPGHVRELPHGRSVGALAFSDDGKLAVTGSTDKKARLWNASTGELLHELLHPAEVYAVAFSHDCHKVLTGGGDRIARLWDVATGGLLVEFVGHRAGIKAVAFSPNDQTVMTGSYDGTARLWHTATGKPLDVPPLEHLGDVRQIAFNDPDGHILLTVSDDRTVRIWDAATALPLGDPVLHGGRVHDAAFSSDGKMVLTGSDDRKARLLDAATAVQIGPDLMHPGAVWSVAFSPDQQWALTGCEDTNARLWRIYPPVGGEAERIRLWTQLITGMKLDRNGAYRHLNCEQWNQCRDELKEHGGLPVP
jgi:WD40 repeat protein